jgi:hypothetical protein
VDLPAIRERLDAERRTLTRDGEVIGARGLVADALPTSRPILERLGFVHLTNTWPCDWSPG